MRRNLHGMVPHCNSRLYTGLFPRLPRPVNPEGGARAGVPQQHGQQGLDAGTGGATPRLTRKNLLEPIVRTLRQHRIACQIRGRPRRMQRRWTGAPC